MGAAVGDGAGRGGGENRARPYNHQQLLFLFVSALAGGCEAHGAGSGMGGGKQRSIIV